MSQQVIPQVPQVNPYIAGSPVTGREMFFGREDVFAFVRQSLVGRHRDNVIVLYGQRRTGKTSALYQLRYQLGDRYLCIFLDLHGFALEGLAGFLWELANHIAQSLRRDYSIDLPRPNRPEFMVDPRGVFERDFLDHLWSAVGDRHVLLMLDEAARLQEHVKAGKLEQEVFAYLRHLMQHDERLNFLFSLGSGLQEMEAAYAFLFNVGLYKEIGLLDHHAATALVTAPVRDYYVVEPAAVERILAVTSGHPYYTQLVCHCLFNHWQQHQAASVTVEDVEAVLDEAVERGLAVLMHVWEDSSVGEWAIMAGMAAAIGEHGSLDDLVDTGAIKRVWKVQGVVLPQREIVTAIRSLLARDVIAGHDAYRFQVDLQRLWVQKFRRLEWVKEEIAQSTQGWVSGSGIPLRISRRAVLAGSAGLAVAAVGGGGWLALTHRSKQPLPLGTRLLTYRGHSGAVRAVAWSSDGTDLVTIGDDNSARAWEAATGTTIATHPSRASSSYAGAVAWMPGLWIASPGLDDSVQVWFPSLGKAAVMGTYSGHSGPVDAVAWSHDHTNLAVAGADGSVQVWDVTTAELIATYRGHSAAVYGMSWCPKALYLASASADGTVQVWDVTGPQLIMSHHHSGPVYAVAWSPVGDISFLDDAFNFHLASAGDDRTVQLWAFDGSTLRTYRGHSGPVYAVAWSPDGTRLVSASGDGTVQMWDAVGSGGHIYTYQGHSHHAVYGLGWSPDGKQLASASADKTVQLWSAT